MEHLQSTESRVVAALGCPMDTADEPELLFNIGDANWKGWKHICKMVAGLERSRIKSLQPRPLEIGSMDANGFVIE
jgi:hypothetical protein